MRILAIVNSDYGRRHVENIRKHAPKEWTLEVWEATRAYPQVIDYPEDYLPESLPPADLILQFAEHKGLAELLPDIAKMTGATAVVAAIDNEAVLPRGLARQLTGWLERMNVACVTPKPLCSLSETHYWLSRREKVAYDNPLIREVARYFGMPQFKIAVDPKTRVITSAEVTRDAACGCARYVADHLAGVSADDAEQEAGIAASPLSLPGGDGRDCRLQRYADAHLRQHHARGGRRAGEGIQAGSIYRARLAE